MAAGDDRVFFALWPDAPVREALASTAHDLALECGGRRMTDASLHLTLLFIGAWPRAGLARLASVAATVSVSAFTLELDKFGCFDHGRLHWLGCARPPEPLLALAAQLRGGLPEVTATPFAAHVTLLRKAEARMPRLVPPKVCWRVREFVLLRSVAGQDARYEVLERWPLVEADAPGGARPGRAQEDAQR